MSYLPDKAELYRSARLHPRPSLMHHRALLAGHKVRCGDSTCPELEGFARRLEELEVCELLEVSAVVSEQLRYTVGEHCRYDLYLEHTGPQISLALSRASKPLGTCCDSAGQRRV